jgi:predicted unusual protein kinase regulating ubiquinone biosynthesis (AarF/ABC1/UbiB family)
MAKLRMMDFATLPVVGALHTARAARTWRVARLAGRALGLWADWRLRRWVRPGANARHRRRFIVRLAAVLREDLGALKGPVMKFGQMASYLTEDLPAALQRALKPLQRRAPPLAATTIRRAVETALCRPLAEIFAEWHDTPLAAASVSQLHLARLHNGRWVVVKVRYPGLPRAVKTDFFLLRCLSPLLRTLWGLPNTRELLNELEDLVKTECDFQKAGAYQEEFRRAFRDDPDMIVPRVYTDLTTPDVLTMEYVEGQTYDEFKARATPEEKNRAAEIIWRMAAVSTNRHGLYNADPHPGNYLFVDGKVAFLDFGITKRFSPAFLALWKEQSLAGCAGDFERFREANRRLGYERRGRTMDHRAMYETYRRLVYRAWMDDRPFRFTREFVRHEIRSLLTLQRGARGALRMPVEFVAILRLLWGQHALLADLGAESNWHRIVFPLLKEPYTPL